MSALRSLMIGDCDHYVSPYMLGVKEAMARLGHHHAEISLRSPAKVIRQRVALYRPDILWTHMLLWPPAGSPPVADLVAIAGEAARRGARIVLHDGDAKRPTRHPWPIADWCSLALVNHAFDRSAWGVPTLRWPYFAACQAAIAPVAPHLRCPLFFAGTLGGGIYAARTRLLAELRARGLEVALPRPGTNTLTGTAAIAASADAVLGFGRPDVPGWVDTRVFQYPGAGALLVHDDAQGYLEPWVHFAPYVSGSAEGVVDAVDKLRALSAEKRQAMRERAFAFVQEKHSSVARVGQVLRHLDLA